MSMIGPAMDELLASLQHLKRASSEERSTWRTFWGLGKPPGSTESDRRPARRTTRVGGS